MNTPNDGGSAFPCESSILVNGKQATVPAQGMTMRDYFAAAALQGMLADSNGNATMIAYVDGAYKFADLMLAERAKTKKTQP